ncbi:cyclase family protein [Halocella sp. SP3-1]|uniref:cyclase family protein n=1 Tax=Halocella sp. SP3-1 TaxID=2382161 RepID=UPI000F74D8D1|nr:cyclase family protein [Halocella sp. SP3-1]AZO95434.1 cyclase family protein [Halocella sp. SP3-1]
MKVTDLTHTIDEDIPVFPGSIQAVIDRMKKYKTDGYRESLLKISSHTGTHVDAPAHMLEGGLFLDEFTVDKYMGKATIISYIEQKTPLIEVDYLAAYNRELTESDFVIIKTGWSKYWGDEKYYGEFPYLSEESARWLKQFNLKGIGIDAISIDSINSQTFANHKILLAEETLIIENLSNLDSIKSKYFILSVMPLKVIKADGSPVRAVAIENV